MAGTIVNHKTLSFSYYTRVANSISQLKLDFIIF